ncbi:hypothetical protein ACT6QH_00725 [Xanthobacter sp. TB0139]|uniref:hypothetical protein n=1 Tax=Xanthobacter sp. TB0139 TaxID=3459178 RepID=UPI00403A035B
MGTHVRERESHVLEFVMVERELLRRRMEAAIEAMLVMLDELDGDPDLEPEEDEPWLGWPDDPESPFIGGGPTIEGEGSAWPEDFDQSHHGKSSGRGWPFFCDTHDLEPNLGSTQGTSQVHWAEGAFDDAEGDEHDGREPDGCVATMAA